MTSARLVGSWVPRTRAHLEKQNTWEKCVFPVYGPVWVDKWPQSASKVTPKWFKVTLIHQKWPQTDPKVSPKSPSYVKSDPKSDVKLTSSSYKIIKICGGNECFFKCTLIYPKWLHHQCKVTIKWYKVTHRYPNWPQSATKITSKWSQRHPHIPQVLPK